MNSARRMEHHQMRLDGITFLLCFLLLVAYGLTVDLLLRAGIFH